MRLPLLIASTAEVSPVVRLFPGEWRLSTEVYEDNFILTRNGEQIFADVQFSGNCEIQLRRVGNKPITVYAEKL